LVARGRLVFRLSVPWLLTLPLASGAALSDARVLLDHGRVTIRSQSAPLADVLSRFAQATGAEVVYDATRPRQLVSVLIEAASPAEAIVQLLEGQGLNYTLRLDSTGRNVEMLVVSVSAAAASAAATRAPRPSAPPQPEEAYEAPAEDAEEPLAGDRAQALEPGVPAGTPSPDETIGPAFAAPFAGLAPGGAPGAEPSSPSAPSGSPAPAQPQPPAVASYPGRAPVGAPLPSPPVYPGPASYPGGE
jgi:hypothetical protein